MNAFAAVYNHDVAEDVTKETSGILQRILLSVVTGARDQTKADDVDMELVQKEARDLYDVRASHSWLSTFFSSYISLYRPHSTFWTASIASSSLQLFQILKRHVNVSVQFEEITFNITIIQLPSEVYGAIFRTAYRDLCGFVPNVGWGFCNALIGNNLLGPILPLTMLRATFIDFSMQAGVGLLVAYGSCYK